MQDLISIFKTLSDPVRLRILNLLKNDELCVCDLISILKVPQSTVSRHLSILKNSNIISARKNGLWHYYKINKKSELEKNVLKLLEDRWNKDKEFLSDSEKLNKSQCNSTNCS